MGALTLLRAGYRVMAGCLQPNAEGATNLLAEADQIAPGQLIIGALDVTNPESVDAFVRQLTKHLERTPKEQFWALINNAGIARLGLLEWGTFQDHYEHLFNVNVFGVVRMTRRCLPLLRSSPTGAFRIVNVNSFLGRITMQPIASYCASKHASVAFTEGLRRELRPFGGQVISIEPNFFATDLCRLEINEREIERQWTRTDAEVKKAYEKFGLLNVWKTVLGSFLFRSLIERNPQQVADAIARSVTDEQPETRVLVAFGWRKWLILTLNWAPREWTEWFLDAFEYGVKVFK